MKRITAVLLAVVLGLSLCACGSGGKTAGISQATWVTYKEVSGKVKNEENKDIFVYSYQQPVVNGAAKGTAIVNTKLDNTTTAFLYGSGGVQELTDLAKMDWEETWFTCYGLTREVTVARIDDTVASFRYSDYSFTGGVHGYMSEYGLTYDMTTGSQLRLEDLSEDEWALKEVCRRYITAYINSEDFPHRDGLLDGYESSLETVLNNWVFTLEGMQFIAQPYIIAPYAVGTLRFTVPYEELMDVLDARWLPGQAPADGGSLQVKAVDISEPTATNFTILEGGENLMVQVNGTVYDFSVEEVNDYTSGGSQVFYVVQQHLYSPMLEDELFGLNLPVPEGAPTMMIRYQDVSGTEHQYYVSYNGKDGGIYLVVADPQLARE